MFQNPALGMSTIHPTTYDFLAVKERSTLFLGKKKKERKKKNFPEHNPGRHNIFPQSVTGKTNQ